MNSLRRMLDILNLFKPEQPIIDVDAICSQLGYSQASAYRYVRELSDVGLLVRLPRGYAVGPRVIELDRHMTDFDPLITCSRDLLDDLVVRTGMHALISELYSSTVINILQKQGRDTEPLNFGRGRPMALFRSATARVILAYLLPRQLKRVYEANIAEADIQRLGANWKGFSKAMLAIRKQGYCMSVSELDPGKTGLAAPLFDEKSRILGAVTLVGSNERFSAFTQDYLVGLVTGVASAISARISTEHPSKETEPIG